LDGHGVDGHLVSGSLKSKLPHLVKKNLSPWPDSLQDMLITVVKQADNMLNKEGIILVYNKF